MQINIKNLPDMEVLYLSSNRGPQDVPKLFFKLEKLVGMKEGRLYGAFWRETGKYWASVAMNDTDDTKIPELKKGILPGGAYACLVLKGRYKDIVKQIPFAFEQMAKNFVVDSKRPSIEHYFRFTEFFLYLPIKTPDNKR